MPSFYKAFFGLILLQSNLSFAQGKLIIKGGTMTIVNSTYLVTTDVSLTDSSTLKVIKSTIKIADSINNNNGTFDVTNGTVEMNGLSAQTIPANAFSTNKIQNLIISNDVTLVGQDSLTGVLSFGIVNSKIFSTGGLLTLKSTDAATANVADLTNNNTSTGNNIIGNVNVERYAFANKKAWWFLSTPTKTIQTIRQAWQEGATTADSDLVKQYGTQVTGAGGIPAGFDIYSSAPSMKKYNSADNSWAGIPNTNIATINDIEGYMVFVRGDRTAKTADAIPTPTVLRTTGELYTGDQPPIAVAANKFASIGNPFAATLNMHNISKFGIKDFFYLWDPKLGGSLGLGGYQTVSNVGGEYVITPGGGSHGNSGAISDTIQSGQAFLVQADAAGGTITFNEASKTGGSGVVSRPSGMQRPQLRTNLYGINADSSTYMIDGILINYDDNYSNKVDGMDAIKSTNTSENFSIKTANTLLVIERRHSIVERDTIFLNLANTKVQQYRFRFTADQLDHQGLTGFLEDGYLHTSTLLNLNGSTLINFNIVKIPGSYAADRFKIVFRPALVLPVSFTSIKAWQQNKNIAVEWKVENEINTRQYETERSSNGTQFTNLSVTAATGNGHRSASYEVTDTRPAVGYNYYRIKSVDLSGRAEYTGLVKVFIGKGAQEIIIYPNPVIDATISIQLNIMPAGKYSVKLLNNLGQKILDKIIIHAEGNSTELITINKNMPHGIYELEIIKPGNEMITSKLIH